jgi:hypothetical protein
VVGTKVFHQRSMDCGDELVAVTLFQEKLSDLVKRDQAAG